MMRYNRSHENVHDPSRVPEALTFIGCGGKKTLTHNEARFEIVMTDPKSGRIFRDASTAKEVDTDATPREREAHIRGEGERMPQSFPKANP